MTEFPPFNRALIVLFHIIMYGNSLCLYSQVSTLSGFIAYWIIINRTLWQTNSKCIERRMQCGNVLIYSIWGNGNLCAFLWKLNNNLPVVWYAKLYKYFHVNEETELEQKVHRSIGINKIKVLESHWVFELIAKESTRIQCNIKDNPYYVRRSNGQLLAGASNTNK